MAINLSSLPDLPCDAQVVVPEDPLHVGRTVPALEQSLHEEPLRFDHRDAGAVATLRRIEVGTGAEVLVELVPFPVLRAALHIGDSAHILPSLDGRSVVWDASNVRHIERDHPERGIGRTEVEEALGDPDRVETAEVRGAIAYHTVVGITGKGRLLVVVWIDHTEGRFPVHARQAGRKAARRYYR